MKVVPKNKSGIQDILQLFIKRNNIFLTIVDSSNIY